MDSPKMAASTLPERVSVVSGSYAALQQTNKRAESGVVPAAPSAPYQPPGIAAVYEAHFQYVYRCLRSLGVRSDLLDDALQDVFLVVQDKLAYFDGRSQLRTWLYAIVLRVARRYRARAAREHQQDCETELSSECASERSLEQQERVQLAQLALASLDDDKREVFVLSQVEQMSAPEIAEVIGIPVNTVYSRLRAARLAFDGFATRMRLRNQGSAR